VLQRLASSSLLTEFECEIVL